MQHPKVQKKLGHLLPFAKRMTFPLPFPGVYAQVEFLMDISAPWGVQAMAGSSTTIPLRYAETLTIAAKWADQTASVSTTGARPTIKFPKPSVDLVVSGFAGLRMQRVDGSIGVCFASMCATLATNTNTDLFTVGFDLQALKAEQTATPDAVGFVNPMNEYAYKLQRSPSCKALMGKDMFAIGSHFYVSKPKVTVRATLPALLVGVCSAGIGTDNGVIFQELWEKDPHVVDRQRAECAPMLDLSLFDVLTDVTNDMLEGVTPPPVVLSMSADVAISGALSMANKAKIAAAIQRMIGGTKTVEITRVEMRNGVARIQYVVKGLASLAESEKLKFEMVNEAPTYATSLKKEMTTEFGGMVQEVTSMVPRAVCNAGGAGCTDYEAVDTSAVCNGAACNPTVDHGTCCKTPAMASASVSFKAMIALAADGTVPLDVQVDITAALKPALKAQVVEVTRITATRTTRLRFLDEARAEIAAVEQGVEEEVSELMDELKEQLVEVVHRRAAAVQTAAAKKYLVKLDFKAGFVTPEETKKFVADMSGDRTQFGTHFAKMLAISNSFFNQTIDDVTLTGATTQRSSCKNMAEADCGFQKELNPKAETSLCAGIWCSTVDAGTCCKQEGAEDTVTIAGAETVKSNSLLVTAGVAAAALAVMQ